MLRERLHFCITFIVIDASLQSIDYLSIRIVVKFCFTCKKKRLRSLERLERKNVFLAD